MCLQLVMLGRRYQKKCVQALCCGDYPWFCLLGAGGIHLHPTYVLMNAITAKTKQDDRNNNRISTVSAEDVGLCPSTVFFMVQKGKHSPFRTLLSRSRQVGRSCKIEALPNVISYNSVCTSCERSGKWWMSLQILRTMRTKRVAASVLTYNSALAACEQAFQWEKTLRQRTGDAGKHQHTPRAIHNFPRTFCRTGFQLVPDLLNERIATFPAKNSYFCWPPRDVPCSKLFSGFQNIASCNEPWKHIRMNWLFGWQTVDGSKIRRSV